MRWDLDSRKLAYESSEKQFEKSQVSFEQELSNLKTILAQDESKASRIKKRGIAVVTGLVMLAVAIGFSIFFLI